MLVGLTNSKVCQLVISLWLGCNYYQGGYYNQIVSMLKLLNLAMRCSNQKPPEQALKMETVLSYYKSNKSTLSIAQHIVHPNQAIKSLYPNYYIYQNLCPDIEKLSPGFCQQSMKPEQIEKGKLYKIFRLIVSAHIGNKDLDLNINQLKANPYLQRLLQLKEKNKFTTKTSQIIIDDIIDEKPGLDVTPMLKANTLETEKLIQTGLGLPISFMISKDNVHSQSWLKILAKKRKAIHSNVIQCAAAQKKSERKGHVLQQIVYNHGYRLQHLFLRPYCRGCPTDLLANNDGFNLQQVLKILSIIDFEGKIILQNTQNFYKNVQFLDLALKKCGYNKKKSGQVDLINEYMIF